MSITFQKFVSPVYRALSSEKDCINSPPAYAPPEYTDKGRVGRANPLNWNSTEHLGAHIEQRSHSEPLSWRGNSPVEWDRGMMAAHALLVNRWDFGYRSVRNSFHPGDSHASDIGHWLRMTPCRERFPRQCAHCHGTTALFKVHAPMPAKFQFP